jgi:HPt (histidine-containing phosphotransfer) domain-containing protein
MMDSIRGRIPRPEPSLDLNDLLERCLGRIELAERILRRFQHALDDDLEQLEQSLWSEDVDRAARIAHRIKGASLAAAACEVRDCAMRLERSAKARELDGARACLEELREAGSRLAQVRVLPTGGGLCEAAHAANGQEGSPCEF